MRKEVILAVFGGALLGLVVAFGIWRANLSMKKGELEPEKPQNQPSVLGLSIASPENESVATTSTITVSGVTSPSAYVVVSGDEDSLALSEKDGKFESEVELTGGVNEITITSLSTSGDTKQEKILVVYSSEFAKLVSTDKPTSTKSGDAVLEKVQQKVEEVKRNPRAILGTITDISQTTLQVKTLAGEIKLAAINEDATYVKVGATTKEIKFSDVALGDFVVAMGFKNGNGVLDTKRVLVTEPFKPSQLDVYLAEILKVDKKAIAVKKLSGEETALEVTTSLSASKFAEGKTTALKVSSLKEKDKIIVVGSRHLFLLP